MSFELFSQSRGIESFKAESLLETAFRPTFLLFVLAILKVLCQDVKIWSKFSEIHSSKCSVVKQINSVLLEQSLFYLVFLSGLINVLFDLSVSLCPVKKIDLVRHSTLKHFFSQISFINKLSFTFLIVSQFKFRLFLVDCLWRNACLFFNSSKASGSICLKFLSFTFCLLQK